MNRREFNTTSNLINDEKVYTVCNLNVANIH